jgi:hypothetical protein
MNQFDFYESVIVGCSTVTASRNLGTSKRHHPRSLVPAIPCNSRTDLAFLKPPKKNDKNYQGGQDVRPFVNPA